MADILEYKCPCCGGAITFDSRLQKMKCPYCDTEFELDTLKEFEEEKLDEDQDPNWEKENVMYSHEEMKEETEGLFSYICESCGGEIIADENMAASRCPYCDNPVIVRKQVNGILRPDVIIPFKLDKRQAEEQLRSHLNGKTLLPSLFKTESRLQEVKGIYVPFWLYDCDAQAEIRCRATRTRRWESEDYQYKETQYYLVSRSGNIGFVNVPVDGSVKMDDALMQSIEPFSYEEAVPFETAYLSGYLADKYDQTSAECAPQANERMRKSTVEAFMDTITGYTSCVPEHTDIQLQQGRIRYALLPVWILHTTYNGNLYTFAMNGQTGKFVGDLPADKAKALWIGGLVFAGVFLFTMLVTMML